MKNARTGDRGNQRGQQRNSGSGAKNLRPDGCFQNEISDCPRCPRHGSAKCPPLLRPRRERAGSKARKPAAHPCGEARVRAGQHIVIHGQRKVCIPTVFTAAPGVIEEFEKTEYAPRLRNTGVVLSYICPLMYMNNPLSKAMPVITSSNKLRTYTTARYYTEEEIITMITKGAN